MQILGMYEEPAKKWWHSCVGQQACVMCSYRNTLYTRGKEQNRRSWLELSGLGNPQPTLSLITEESRKGFYSSLVCAPSHADQKTPCAQKNILPILSAGSTYQWKENILK